MDPKDLAPVERFVANDTAIASAGGELSQEPDFEIAMAAIAAPVVLKDDAGNDVSHPANRGQMLRAPDTAAWRESEDDEIRSNEKNKTLQLTTQTLSELKSQGYETVSSTFVNKPKPRSDGKLEKRKTRLCARPVRILRPDYLRGNPCIPCPSPGDHMRAECRSATSAGRHCVSISDTYLEGENYKLLLLNMIHNP